MKFTILGAGKTGRGFLARMLYEAGIEPTLIDTSKLLIDELKGRKSFYVRFFGDSRPPIQIPVSTAMYATTPEAELEIAGSDVILVSVGASNIPDVGRKIGASLAHRKKTTPLLIITAENAIEPANKLDSIIRQEFDGATYGNDVQYIISEAAVFCSTIEQPGSPVDILSEAYDGLPYDATRIPESSLLPPFFSPESNFPLLLTRKIFTYNAASAVIAYLGSYKGYEWYADAANDEDIVAILDRFYEEINELLCHVYSIPEEDQKQFAQASKTKFQNTVIRDSIERNTRDAMRKLASDERMVGPLLLARAHGRALKTMHLVIAAAIVYGLHTQESRIVHTYHEGGIAALLPMFDKNDEIIASITTCFNQLQHKETGAFTCIF